MYQFRLYNKVNRLQVYIYPLPLGLPPTHRTKPQPSGSSQSARLSALCYTAASHSLLCTHGVYTPMLLSQCPPPSASPPPCPHVHSHMETTSNGKLDSHPWRQNDGVFRCAEPQKFPSLNLRQEAMCPIRQVGKPGQKTWNRENRYPQWEGG